MINSNINKSNGTQADSTDILQKFICSNFAPPDQKSFRDLIESHEEKLFTAIVESRSVRPTPTEREDNLRYLR